MGEMFMTQFLDELNDSKLDKAIVLYFSNRDIDIYSNPASLIRYIDLRDFEKQKNVTNEEVVKLLEAKKKFYV